MWFCGCYYSSAWKGTSVCQALCGSLSDREFMSKIGRASSRGREEGMEQERLAQPGEDKQGSSSQGPKAMKLGWRAMSRRGRWALEQIAVNGWVWPAKTVQNTLASDPAAPAAVLPVLAFAFAFAGLLPAFLFSRQGVVGDNMVRGTWQEYTQRYKGYLSENVWIQPLKGGRWLFRAPNSLLLLCPLNHLLMLLGAPQLPKQSTRNKSWQRYWFLWAVWFICLPEGNVPSNQKKIQQNHLPWCPHIFRWKDLLQLGKMIRICKRGRGEFFLPFYDWGAVMDITSASQPWVCPKRRVPGGFSTNTPAHSLA